MSTLTARFEGEKNRCSRESLFVETGLEEARALRELVRMKDRQLAEKDGQIGECSREIRRLKLEMARLRRAAGER